MARAGRERFQRHFDPRFDEKGRQSGWGVAPPSRHLWVGNLTPHVTESALLEQFFRFGDIDNIAFVPGRNYAFVNFKKEEDAVLALRELKGFILGGMPLRIEFAKGDRALSQDEDYPRYNDVRRSVERGDSRSSYLNPDNKSYDKSKRNNNTEPSEVLWIGFPSHLKIDEMALRKAFSPFGEIDNISTFPGRSFAFVRFRSVVAACRAKEALQGKLFNNPRVSICFAKSDVEGDQGRAVSDDSLPLHYRTTHNFGRQSSDSFRRDENFHSGVVESPMASPHFVPHWERMSGNAGDPIFGKKASLRAGPSMGPGSFDMGLQRRVSVDGNQLHENSSTAERSAPWHDFPLDKKQRSPHFEDSWGMDYGSFPLSKKLKMDPFSDGDLPEYSLSEMSRERLDNKPRFLPSLNKNDTLKRSVDSMHFEQLGFPDDLRNPTHSYADDEDPWKPSERFNAGSALSNFASVNSNQPNKPSLQEVWKWEGTLAKGGTPICRARCFPVGKVLEYMLPDFLDCTARTGLDMLAKHYYQAASSWVVFFVPESDSDITFYNEFMHYLGEKQRAAVAKLGEKTTLFLVPPSEFSEQVLKVPGKVSITGVILKFQQPSSNFNSLHHQHETVEPNNVTFRMHQPVDAVNFRQDASLEKPSSPHLSSSHVQNYFDPMKGHLPPVTSAVLPPLPPLPPPPPLPPVSKFPTKLETISEPSLPMPASLRPEQLAQLASLLAQQKEVQTSTSSAPGSQPLNLSLPMSSVVPQSIQSPMPLRQQPNQTQQMQSHHSSVGQPLNQMHHPPQHPNSFAGQQPNQIHRPHQYPNSSSGQLPNQMPQLQQLPNFPSAQQGKHLKQNNQQSSNTSGETEADPHKRLQATLQLAAALVQQIHQQTKTEEQK